MAANPAFPDPIRSADLPRRQRRRRTAPTDPGSLKRRPPTDRRPNNEPPETKIQKSKLKQKK